MTIWAWLAAGGSIPAEKLKSIFADWAVLYHRAGGEPAAAALVKGTEVHFVAAPNWRRRVITRRSARGFIGQLLVATGGLVTTRLLHDSTAAADFLRRLGFQETWRDERFAYYALTELPFNRGNR